MSMIDYNTGNFIGAGEKSAFMIISNLTNLPFVEQNKLFFSTRSGIFKQIPIQYLLNSDDLTDLSEAHKKGSIDICMKINDMIIAVRIQGKGHGEGLKGIGKARHDKVQKRIISKYCQVVDILHQECIELFKENVNETSVKEIRDAFITAGVDIEQIF